MTFMKGSRGRLASSRTGPVELDRESKPRHRDLGRQHKVGLGSARDREPGCGRMLGWGRAYGRAARGRTVWRWSVNWIGCEFWNSN